MARSETLVTPRRRRVDRRTTGALLTLLAVVLLGALIAFLPSDQTLPIPDEANSPAIAPTSAAVSTQEQMATTPQFGATDKDYPSPLAAELDQHFQRGAMLLHAGQYEYALLALNRVILIAPRMPEAYVNIGFAHLGLGNYTQANEAFLAAIDLRPQLVNAYYGLAIALEGQQDLAGAIGAMQSFVHLSEPDNPYLRKAQSALWEWREQHNTQRGSEKRSEPTDPSPDNQPQTNPAQ